MKTTYSIARPEMKNKGGVMAVDEVRTPGYWAVLPAKVRYDKSLRPNAKLLYAEIQALADATGYCWARNETLGHHFGIAAKTVSSLVSQLAERGYITVEVVRDPETNAVMERRIWVDTPRIEASQPPLKIEHTPMPENEDTPPLKIEQYNNLKDSSNIPPKAPQGGRRIKTLRKKAEPKEAPDWKPDRFTGFWRYYPRGQAKQAAIRAWDRLQPSDELIATMAQALKRQVASEDWQAGIGIPYASTWLNNRRWEDESRARPERRGEPAEPSPVHVVEREVLETW